MTICEGFYLKQMICDEIILIVVRYFVISPFIHLDIPCFYKFLCFILLIHVFILNYQEYIQFKSYH